MIENNKIIFGLAGIEALESSLIGLLNEELEEHNAKVLGMNIAEDTFDFFIANLAYSKVVKVIFLPEYQQKVAQFLEVEGCVMAVLVEQQELTPLIVNEPHINEQKILNFLLGENA